MHPNIGRLLHPLAFWVLPVLAGAWVATLWWPLTAIWPNPGFWHRLCGYLATLTMLVPYLHILRRRFRHRPWGLMSRWMWWHIAAAYIAFALVLIHSRGQASSLLSQMLVICLWIVMISGFVGYFGQKLLYRILPKLVERELGMERIPLQRDYLEQRGAILAASLWIKEWKAFCKNLSEEKKYPLSTLLGLFAISEEPHEATAKAPAKEVPAIPAPTADSPAAVVPAAPPKVVKKSNPLESSWKTFNAEERKAAGERKLDKVHEAQTQIARAFDDLLSNQKWDEPLKLSEAGNWGALNPRWTTDVMQLAQSQPSDDPHNEQLQGRLRVYQMVAGCNPADFAPPSEQLMAFSTDILKRSLNAPLRLLAPQSERKLSRSLSENTLAQVRASLTGPQSETVQQLWQVYRERNQLNLEYRLHQLGRLWLLVHGPVSWALLVLIVVHICMSVWYGGF